MMEKQTLIKKTLDTLSKLPKQEIKEVSDFADFILKKYEEKTLQKGIEKSTMASVNRNLKKLLKLDD